MNSLKIIVTGGAGFIGSAVIRYLIKETPNFVLNLDKLTYAGNLESLDEILASPRYTFEQIDICDTIKIRQILNQYQPDIIMHLAAESHVDRSIDGPDDFIKTNIVGTYTLLEEARKYWQTLDLIKKQAFRFHHISTDEVYGSLNGVGLFNESAGYDPSSPYSASKASSDHLVRAWHRTYDLPVLITNCSNNYGPYQYPEKLIPLMTLNALNGKPMPIYGNGEQVRDWLHVDDHARALYTVITEGKVGETYNIGGHNRKTNLEVVNTICQVLEELAPQHPGNIDRYDELITFVEDRPGHDQYYAVDTSKIQNELGWTPAETFYSGIRKTIEWYLGNQAWVQNVLDENYQLERLGLTVLSSQPSESSRVIFR